MAINTAEQVLDLYWDNIIPVDLKAIAKKAGVKVIFTDLEGILAGEYLSNEKGTPVCKINHNDYKKRQRFTLAHELGHHFLHHGHSFRDNANYSSSFDPKERQANIFAANILMPKKAMDFIIRKKNVNTIHELANIFDVSVPAMSIRLKELGYSAY